MTVGKGYTFLRQPIHVGRFEFGIRIECTNVSVALVVGVDHDDVGF